MHHDDLPAIAVRMRVFSVGRQWVAIAVAIPKCLDGRVMQDYSSLRSLPEDATNFEARRHG